MKYPIYIILLFTLLVASCTNKKKSVTSTVCEVELTDFQKAMTQEDTTNVLVVVDKFFNYVIEKKYYDAAGMLYRFEIKKEGQLELLNNDELVQMVDFLKKYPIVEYSVFSINFNEYYSNDLICRVKIHGEGYPDPVYTKIRFRFVNYLGNWLLCMDNGFSRL